jgi:hypothetical protein
MRIKIALMVSGFAALAVFGLATYLSAHGGDTTRIHSCVAQNGTIRTSCLASIV